MGTKSAWFDYNTMLLLPAGLAIAFEEALLNAGCQVPCPAVINDAQEAEQVVGVQDLV